MKTKSRILIIFIVIILLFSNMSAMAQVENVEDSSNTKLYKAKVLEVENVELEDKTLMSQYQKVKIELISGPDKGEVLEIKNYLGEQQAYNIPVKKGQTVLVTRENFEHLGEEYFIADHYRQGYLLIITLLFIVLLIIIGRIKGIKAIITLGFAFILLFQGLLPLLLKGYSPLLLSSVYAIIVTIFTILVVGGISTKSFAAILGTSIGVLASALLAWSVGNLTSLTGLSGEEARMFFYIPKEVEISPQNLLYSGMLLGALGAIMDVGMSISSAINEIYQANPSISKKDLYISGMNVGRDIMGTMTNTLVLAYLGTSLPLILMFFVFSNNPVKFLNLEIIATEIIRIISGSIGLVLSIPITAAISVLFIERQGVK